MNKCQVCEGLGMLYSFNTKEDRQEIQRCDECAKFESDQDAQFMAFKCYQVNS